LKKLLASLARQSPSMIVAMLALFVAMGGTAIAASTALITGKQIKNSSITGLDVKNKSLTPKDFRGSVRGRTGARGPAGPTGPAGPAGAAGAKGDKGDTGAAGQDLTSTSTLPPGQTLTGVFIASGGSSASGYATTNWQFHPRLPANLDGAHTIFQTPGTTSANCPAIDTAQPGYLCVYANQFTNMTFNSFNNTQGTTGANRNGGLIFFNVTGASSYATGRWAVTAPLGTAAAGANSKAKSTSPN
jgi:hypothetical protein